MNFHRSADSVLGAQDELHRAGEKLNVMREVEGRRLS
jgi:hypothetical protein